MKHEHRISKIETGSIAEELGIEPGDVLVSINDNEIEDVFDYHYYVNDEELLLLVHVLFYRPDAERNEGNIVF